MQGESRDGSKIYEGDYVERVMAEAKCAVLLFNTLDGDHPSSIIPSDRDALMRLSAFA